MTILKSLLFLLLLFHYLLLQLLYGLFKSLEELAKFLGTSPHSTGECDIGHMRILFSMTPVIAEADLSDLSQLTSRDNDAMAHHPLAVKDGAKLSQIAAINAIDIQLHGHRDAIAGTLQHSAFVPHCCRLGQCPHQLKALLPLLPQLTNGGLPH